MYKMGWSVSVCSYPGRLFLELMFVLVFAPHFLCDELNNLYQYKPMLRSRQFLKSCLSTTIIGVIFISSIYDTCSQTRTSLTCPSPSPKNPASSHQVSHLPLDADPVLSSHISLGLCDAQKADVYTRPPHSPLIFHP